MQQIAIDWTAPISGNTPQSRHASWTGARHATRSMGAKMQALLQLLEHHGAKTDQEIAQITGWPLSSVCSSRNNLVRYAEMYGGFQIVPDGFDTMEWGPGDVTRRTRWVVRQTPK
jgi:hypothetical protein